jgi:hypothetical protein
MDKEKLAEFNRELKELLAKYDVSLIVEDVPATKRISVVSNQKETSEVTGSEDVK